MVKYPVYLGRCETYSVNRVTTVLNQALEKIPIILPDQGKIVIKPNLVMAHPVVATEAYTRKEVVEGVVRVMREKTQYPVSISVVEKSGLGITTSGAYRYAGYTTLKKTLGVKLVAREESRRQHVVLKNSKIHTHISVAKAMVDRDFLIFCPKLKTNVLSDGYSGALKLNIGTIDSGERLFHHHYDLDQKIVDLLEIANPDLIVTDGIRMAFGGNQMTQHGKDLGILVVSTNAVAHDMVCAHLLSLDPFEIRHIRAAMERGYGPTSFDEIELMGDDTVERAQSVTQSLDNGLMPVHTFTSPFDIHSGTPYCAGGCHGIFLDWLHMIKDRKPGLLKRFPRVTVLIGHVEKKIKARKVLLVGDCAHANVHIEAKRVYKIKGCPPSHKRIIWDMMVKLYIFNPLIRPSLIYDGFIKYPLKKLKGYLINRF